MAGTKPVCSDRSSTGWSIPVSYTHLDVYKRQDVNVGTGKMTFRFERDCVSVWMTACAEFFLTEYRGFGWGCFSAD